MSAEDQNAELEETVTETAETCSDEVRLDEEEAKDDSPSAPDGEAAKEPTRMMLLRQLLFPRASEITGDLATTSIISTLVALVFSVVWVVAIIASVAILVAGFAVLGGSSPLWQKILFPFLSALFAVTVFLVGRIFWRAGREIEHLEDKQYVVNVFGAMMAAGAVLIAVITLFVSIAV